MEKHWSGYNGGIKSTEIIFSNIENLSSKKSSSEDAYVSFKTYFIRNSISFNEDLKHKIIEGAEEIATLFSELGIEHKLLERLEKLLFTKTKRIKK